MKTIYIFNTSIILPDKILRHSSLLIKGSKIISIGGHVVKNAQRINARGMYLAPGFIDTHIHGSPREIFQNEIKHGTTSILVALSCGKGLDNKQSAPFAANMLGVRIEGPFINRSMAGAQDARYIQHPSVTEFNKIIKRYGQTLKMVTIAPEIDGAKEIVRRCSKAGIIASIGHTNASYDEAMQSMTDGIYHATHIFNAMSGPRYGVCGAGMAAMLNGKVTAEVIADFVHVDKKLISALLELKSHNKIILVTDSVRAEAGRSVKFYRGAYRFRDGHIAGSGVSMMDCVKNIVRRCGVGLVDAVNMATLNPARLLKAGGYKGRIKKGMDADLALFDKNFNVKLTIINGKIAYKSKDLKCAE